MEKCKSWCIIYSDFFYSRAVLIGFYLEKVAPGSAYGAAGSIVIILLWVYYASAILYIGAEFTQVYSEAMGNRIEPSAYAVYIEQPEEKKSVGVTAATLVDIKARQLSIKTIIFLTVTAGHFTATATVAVLQ